MPKIYCAGPLFNPKEREEMEEIANSLESSGYNVFLPHRDGLEFSNLFATYRQQGISDEVARHVLNKAIFALDVFQVLLCDGLVVNINGRVPDEGAMVEAGIAWNAGKKIVIFKNDTRTLLDGNDNPLLLGLANFQVVNNVKEISLAFQSGIFQASPTTNNDIYNIGEKIAHITENKFDHLLICQRLIELMEVESNERFKS